MITQRRNAGNAQRTAVGALLVMVTVVAAACSYGALLTGPSSTSIGTTSSVPQSTLGGGDTGWELTVYVTAVEQYYTGAVENVIGCLSLNCDTTDDSYELGTFPEGFVNRVQDEGTGLITAGPQAGMYLNWSAGISTTGFWLDTAPRDSYGDPLIPFVSAAADGVPRGTEVRIVSCGTNQDGTSVDPTVCSRFEQSDWQIRDQFTPGLGGARHMDLYIGKETQANFEQESPYWITFEGATVAFP